MFSVGYNLAYNNYTWRRAPMLKQDINLDNHNVKIEEYTFTYKSDGTFFVPFIPLRPLEYTVGTVIYFQACFTPASASASS